MTATVALSDAEVKLLKELLQGDMCRLILEIAHTDHRSMRDGSCVASAPQHWGVSAHHQASLRCRRNAPLVR